MNVEPFSLPLSNPLTTAQGSIDSRDGFLVRLELDGAVGVGEATPLAGWTESLEACEAALKRVESPEAAIDELDDAPAARHGVSLALLDARSRAAGEPLYAYLGANSRVDSVPVNATVGDGSPTETAAAADAAVEAGYPALKLKVGARSVAADASRLAAVRERCPDVELRADANGGWSRREAERAFAAFADDDVSFVEQPRPAADLEGCRSLRGGAVGVAIDEGVVEHGIEAVLDADAADVVVIKPMALGGIDRALEAALRARSAGVEPILTTTIDGAVARAGTVHAVASLPSLRPCGLATGDRLQSDLSSDLAAVSGGALPVPQGKGNIPPL